MKFLILLYAAAAMVPHSTDLPPATRQLLVVTTDSWRSAVGNLQRYERHGQKWEQIGRAIPVSVGKKGLAWGRGLNRYMNETHLKREGDGCAPAGVFRIGPAFGYARRVPAGCKLKYRAATARDYFIDDPDSSDYNHWATIPPNEPNQPEKIWRSFERMKRHDRLYEFGLVIQQNDHPVVKGKGSAVFLHVWRGVGVPTVGCTAMARDNLLELLRWLKPEDRPLLVQAPVSELKNIFAINIAPVVSGER